MSTESTEKKATATTETDEKKPDTDHQGTGETAAAVESEELMSPLNRHQTIEAE